MSAVLWPGAEVRGTRNLTQGTEAPSVLGDHARVTLRTIRVGIAGLGQVGQAVARLAPEVARLRESGLRVRVLGALVRDIDRPRRCPKPARLTSNPAAFLRGNYDVVVEALGEVETARALVGRLLGRGIPVVTANKALVAAHGAELSALAMRRGTSLRYEASALAGVPFLGALAARPLVSDVHQFSAIVNGTSNFVLSAIEADVCSFERALGMAQTLGLTEPDPSRDLDGLDALDKLTLLAKLFGWGPVSSGDIEVDGIRDIGHEDVAAARSLGYAIKPLVRASRTAASLEAFVGPTLVPLRHPLASLGGSLSGIQLAGRFISDLFFSGPGAGPEITAATILDDVVEAVSSVPKAPRPPRRVGPALATTPPSTGWLISTRFPGLVPEGAALRDTFASFNLPVQEVTEAMNDARWVLVEKAPRAHVTAALAKLFDTHRIRSRALRVI
jgi:homoserine dehydrogenase